MIAHLTGRLAFKAPTHLALDVHGVGYEEDAIQLFGFSTRQEKDAFVLLMSVSGIGPKSALGILSALPVADLASAIHSGDIEKLETVPGIGKKSAGRLVLELKDKLAKFHPALTPTVDESSAGRDDVFDDALSALTNLGYRATDAKDALKLVRKSPAQPVSLQELIRETLKQLARV
ncbi:MAG: ruvA [Nitrospira sp.]|nr:ruvA [Nitrospira sp.]